MVAGIPGTGIGGFFYLLSALLMPFHELFVLVKGKSSFKRWRTIVIQTGLALGVIAGIWITGWGLGFLMHAAVKGPYALTGEKSVNLIRAASISLSLLTLVFVILVTAFLSLLTGTSKKAPPREILISKRTN